MPSWNPVFAKRSFNFFLFFFFPFFFSRDPSLHDATCAAEKVSGNVLTKLLSNFSLSFFAESANFERYKNWGEGRREMIRFLFSFFCISCSNYE